MIRLLTIIAVALSLAGCGLGETAVSAAAGGASDVKAAQEAKATEARVRAELDAAARATEQQREGAERATR